ncbi:MAG: hypothetical protein ACKVPX_11720 [Myxococcaceae bacterium]
MRIREPATPGFGAKATTPSTENAEFSEGSLRDAFQTIPTPFEAGSPTVSLATTHPFSLNAGTLGLLGAQPPISTSKSTPALDAEAIAVAEVFGADAVARWADMTDLERADAYAGATAARIQVASLPPRRAALSEFHAGLVQNATGVTPLAFAALSPADKTEQLRATALKVLGDSRDDNGKWEWVAASQAAASPEETAAARQLWNARLEAYIGPLPDGDRILLRMPQSDYREMQDRSPQEQSEMFAAVLAQPGAGTADVSQLSEDDRNRLGVVATWWKQQRRSASVGDAAALKALEASGATAEAQAAFAGLMQNGSRADITALKERAGSLGLFGRRELESKLIVDDTTRAVVNRAKARYPDWDNQTLGEQAMHLRAENLCQASTLASSLVDAAP